LVDATIRETAEIYYEKGGWKLHLRVAPENYQAVHAWLWQETTVGYKHLHGGEPDEKDFTIYVCSKREADELARRISQQIGHLLKNPSSTMEEHDIELAPKVGGRFDMRHLINSEGSPFYEVARQFTPYGYKGIPFLDTDHGRFEVNIVKALHTRGTKLGSPEAIAFSRQALLFQEPGRSERAFRVLAEAYGEYFTGGAKSIEELRRGKNVDYPVKPAAEASVFTEQPKGNDSKKNPGGIDFRHLPIVTQSLGNLKASIRAMPQAGLERINLAQEWSDIERLVNSGITPSAERLKDYLAASCFSGNLNSDMEKIVACISDILRTEESTCQPTDPALKDILVVLGSGRSGEEIEEVFTGAFPL
jgi:hypothetical protein